MSPKDDWNDQLDDLDAREDKLSTWEIDFVESIREQLQNGRTLSERQAEVLDRIHREKTREKTR